MRELLFRGKSETNGEWVYGYYYYEISNESPASNRIREKHHIFTVNYDKFVIPETVGQYIGLKDANGKRIVEGDIVKYCIHIKGCEHLDKNYIVEFSFGGFRLRENLFDEFSDYVDNDSVNWDRCEVIGNIYDNPELLEAQDESNND